REVPARPAGCPGGPTVRHVGRDLPAGAGAGALVYRRTPGSHKILSALDLLTKTWHKWANCHSSQKARPGDGERAFCCPEPMTKRRTYSDDEIRAAVEKAGSI